MKFDVARKHQADMRDCLDAANFSRLEWTVEGLRQEGASQVVVEDAVAGISVRMRTGTDDNPRVFFRLADRFTREREEVTEDEYNKLGREEQVEPQEDQVDWSLWSSPFTASGQRITLPSPRRYFQFEIDMESHVELCAGEILRDRYTALVKEFKNHADRTF
ncbi:MAG: hypothetical protein IH805_01085 [Proteobacteria bacterium]|nr:hypothetical protein [Pseudomonadota bacterium]